MKPSTNVVVIIVLGVICICLGFQYYSSNQTSSHIPPHVFSRTNMSPPRTNMSPPQTNCTYSHTHLSPQSPSQVVDTAVWQLRNETDKIIKDIKTKFGPIEFSGIHPVNTLFTNVEQEQYTHCLDTYEADHQKGYAGFWGTTEAVRAIRTRNHTYLKREDAVLLEVGGNRGDDASLFVSLFNPRFIILEPIEHYANILRKKFAANPRVTVVNLGLGKTEETIMVKPHGNDGDATSMFDKQRGDTPLHIVNTTSFLLKLGVGLFDFDLMTLNCEGCEYVVLEEVISSTAVNHFKNIQFATHSTIGIPESKSRYCKIRTLLSRTHRPIYEYKVIWESWRRKDVE